VDEPADAELLLIDEAARGLAGDGVRRVVGAIRKAALAPGVIEYWKTLPLSSVMAEIEPS
jgi:hypothetical protein